MTARATNRLRTGVRRRLVPGLSQAWTRVPFRRVVQNNPVDQDYRPGYPIEHALKDLKLIESSATELGLSTLGMPEIISVYEAAVQQGLAMKDISAMAEVLQ